MVQSLFYRTTHDRKTSTWQALSITTICGTTSRGLISAFIPSTYFWYPRLILICSCFTFVMNSTSWTWATLAKGSPSPCLLLFWIWRNLTQTPSSLHPRHSTRFSKSPPSRWAPKCFWMIKNGEKEWLSCREYRALENEYGTTPLSFT